MSLLKKEAALSSPHCSVDLTREENKETQQLEERHEGLGSRGRINQQAGLIRPNAVGFFFFIFVLFSFFISQQESKSDKAPPVSRGLMEGRKKKHKAQGGE